LGAAVNRSRLKRANVEERAARSGVGEVLWAGDCQISRLTKQRSYNGLAEPPGLRIRVNGIRLRGD
jgi:hypothetical protein